MTSKNTSKTPLTPGHTSRKGKTQPFKPSALYKSLLLALSFVGAAMPASAEQAAETVEGDALVPTTYTLQNLGLIREVGSDAKTKGEPEVRTVSKYNSFTKSEFEKYSAPATQSYVYNGSSGELPALGRGISLFQTPINPGVNIPTTLTAVNNYDVILTDDAVWTTNFTQGAAIPNVTVDGAGNTINVGLANRMVTLDLAPTGSKLTIKNANVTTTPSANGMHVPLFYYVTAAKTVNLDLSNSTFTGFAGTSLGGSGVTGNIFYAYGANAVMNVDGGVEGVTFSRNRGVGDAAGVAFVNGSGTMNFDGKVAFDSNWTGNYGGAVAMDYGRVNFNGDTTFTNNHSSTFGGALDMWGGSSQVTFNGPATFTSNYVYGTTAISEQYPFHITDQHVRGGAINIGYVAPAAAGTFLVFNDKADFLNNYVINAKPAGNATKDAYGGAISVYGNGAALNYRVAFNGPTTFDGNYVYSVNGGSGHGGAVYYDSSAASLDIGGGSSFTNNYAQTLGGAIYLRSGSINLNAQTGSIKFQGNRQGASFNNIDPTYTPIAGSGKPNAIYLGSSGTLSMDVGAGQKIEFYDPIASANLVNVTINKTGDGETIFYGDGTVNSDYSSDIRANTNVLGGTYTLKEGVAYGNTAAGTFTVATVGTLKGATQGELRAQTVNINSGGTIAVDGGTFNINSGNINFGDQGVLGGFGTLTTSFNIKLAGANATGIINAAAGKTLTIDSVIQSLAANQGIKKTGTGVAQLNQAVNYTGATTIEEGTLQAMLVDGFATSSGITVGDAGKFDLNNFDQSIKTLNAAGAGKTAAVDLTSANLTVTNGGTFNGVVSGAGNMNIAGGTLTLTNSNTHTGQTNIASGATLQLGNGTAGNDGSMTGDGVLTNDGTLIFNSFGDTANNVVITGGGSVTQQGNGVLTLTGNNTYTNGTLVSAGTLKLDHAEGAGTGTITNNSHAELNFDGTFDNAIAGTGDTKVTGGKAVTLAGANSGYTGAWNIAGTANTAGLNNLGSGAINLDGTLNITPTSGGVNFTNVLAGAGALNVNLASSTDAFSFGALTGTGFTGTLQLGQSSFALSGANTTVLGGATLKLNAGNSTTVGAGTQNIGNLNINGSKLKFSNVGTDLIATGSLVLGSGDIEIDPSGIAASGGSLLIQDDGSSNQLISATAVSGDASNLNLVDSAGNPITNAINDITQNSDVVAKGSYAYSLDTGATNNGLYLAYRLSQLEILAGKTLLLEGDTATPAGADTLTAKLTGTGNLNVVATDIITLTNANNDYTGTTAVNGGTLKLGSNNALGQTSELSITAGATADINGKTQTIGALAGAGNLGVNGGNLTISNGGNFSGVIAGTAGNLNLGGGTLALTGANTYTGTTTVTGGTLAIGSGGTTGSYAGDITNNAAVEFNRSDALTYAGAVSGTGTLTKNGADTLTLTGNNTYAGGTTINAGALQIGNGGATGSITGDVTNNGSLIYNRSDAVTNSGVISGTGSVTQAGVGTLTLSGTNGYADGTTINAGTVNLSAAGAAGTGNIANASNLVLSFSNGTLANTLTGVGATQVTGSGVTITGANAGYTGSWDIDGSANIAGMNNLGFGAIDLAGTLNVAPTGGNLSFSNALTGNGLLTVAMASGTDIFDLAGAGNAFAGTVQLGNSTFGLSSTNTAALTDAILKLNAGNTTTVGNGNQTIQGLNLNGGTLVFNGQIPSGTQADGIITTTGDLTIAGAGVVQIDAPTAGSGGMVNPVPAPGKNLLEQDDNPILVTLANGHVVGDVALLTLQDQSENALGNNTIIEITEGGSTVADASYGYNLTSGDSQDGLYVSYGLTQLALKAGQTLSLAPEASAAGTAAELKAKVTGAGGLSVDGSAATDQTLTLTNSTNDYTGTTAVNGGTLKLGSNNALGQTSELSITAGATADINGKTQTIGALAGAGNLGVNGGNLTISNGGNFSGVIAGTAGNLNLGGGTLALTGANTYTGTTTVTGGTLAIGSGGTTGSYAGDITNNAAVEFNRSDALTYAGAVSGTGTLTKNGADTLTLTGNNTYAGGTTINAGALQIGNGGATGSITGDVTNNGSLIYNRSDAVTNSGVISGTGSVTQAGVGTLTLSGTNGYADGTTINAGTVNLSAAGAAGTGNIANASNLVLSFSNGTLANTLTGVGATQVTGSGVTITGANAGYTGSWDIDGSANIAGMNNLGTGAVNIDGTLNLNAAGAVNFNNVLTGAGKLDASMGSATDTFEFGASAGAGFTGTLDLTQGTINLNSANNQSSLSNATLQLNSGTIANNTTANSTIGNLTLNGGQLNVGMTGSATTHVLNVGHLDVDASAATPADLGTINLDVASLAGGSAIFGVNFLDQDNAATSGGIQIVKADSVSSNGKQLALTLQGAEPVDTTYNNQDDGFGNADIDATYSYMAVSSTDHTDGAGIYVDYILTTLKTNSNLVLSTAGATDTNLGAQITGAGNVEYRGGAGTIELLNGANDYQGKSLVTDGTLLFGANNVLGNTNELEIAGAATVDMAGYSQTVGAFTGQTGSTLNLNGGAMTIADGGTSDGTLTGAGTLAFAGGSTVINGGNAGLSADVSIANGATAQINDVVGLGSGAIDNAGTFTLSAVNGNVANQILGTGAINVQSNSDAGLTGDNSAYSGAIDIDAGSRLTSYAMNNIGTASFINDGELIINESADATFANAMTGSGIFTKDGAGILRLASDYGHTGGTNVNAGTLLLDNASAALSGNGPVNIAANATLGGYGSITGDVTNSGTLAVADAVNGASGGMGSLTIQGNLINHNTVRLAGSSVGNVLNITGDYSAASDLIINTVLGGDNSATDKMVVQGSTSGNTNVTVHNQGGTGAQTVTGIEIVEVQGSSDGIFNLANRLVAGAYDYDLVQSGKNWYLQSRTEAPAPVIRPEIGAYLANQSAAKDMFTSSMYSRAGDRLFIAKEHGNHNLNSWIRVGGDVTKSQAAGQIDQKIWSSNMQIGTDIINNNADVNRVHIGVMAGAGNAHTRSKNLGAMETANSELDGYSVGVYGTWFANADPAASGPYADAWMQHSWFDNTIKGQGLAKQDYNSTVFAASLEGGWSFRVHENQATGSYTIVQPQAQLIYSNYRADNFYEHNGTYVQNHNDNGVSSRLGVRAFSHMKTASGLELEPFVEANWLYDNSVSKVSMNGTSFKSDQPKSRLDLKVGVQSQITDSWSVWGQVGGQIGRNDYSRFGGTVGVQYRW